MIPVTSADEWVDQPRWAPDGRGIVYLSRRDHFLCIWRQGLDGNMYASGTPQAVTHLHTVRLSPEHLSRQALNLSVSASGVLFNAGEIRANVWLATPDQ
jgi:hypothetical protein